MQAIYARKNPGKICIQNQRNMLYKYHYMRTKITLSGPLVLIFALWGTALAQAQENSTESILARINGLLSESKHNEAIALFDTIPLPDRDSTPLRLFRASVLSSAGKHPEARALVETISRSDPNNIEVLFMLSNIEGAAGRRRQQQTALERIIRIDPNNAEALVELGNISMRNRNVRNAASYFHRVLTNDSNNAQALIGLARAYRANREYDEAEGLYNHAVKLHPTLPEAWSERARFYKGRGFLVQALSDLNEAIKLAPNDYWISIDRGTLLMEMNRKPAALTEFNRAISISPGEFLAYAYSSGLKDDLGDPDGAERDYAVLARLRPDYYYALEGLGLHKMRNENWAEARDIFREAYRRAPQEHFYALLAAINWMRAENVTSPRNFLREAHGRVKRDTLEWYMFRLFHDLTGRTFAGETDMIRRIEQESDENLKARMMFYLAQYYDVRGNTAIANRYYTMVSNMGPRAIPEWRLNEWIVAARELKSL